MSSAAGLIALRFRLPGGVIVWALAAAASLHLAVADLEPLPGAFRTAAQILIGVAIGTEITRSPLRALHDVRGALAVEMAAVVLLCAGAGCLLAALTPLDASTALFALVPGGASDMAVAAVWFGLDAALVAGFQVVRQLLVFVVVPLVLGRK
ncbi:AbrB family transcriptional regulator [Saccharopolyspora sp. 5N708]|uniref:AbrB family transcriptional regulator n=1 Tax=Saccharopolyspora sp. 5N708 TaxID=3457424 RepID=UPI003FD2C162